MVRVKYSFGLLSLVLLLWLGAGPPASSILGNPPGCCGGTAAPVPLGHAPPTIAPGAPLAVVPAEPVDPPPPAISVRVRVPACILPGKEVEYRIFVENCSAGDAHHVVLRNPLPANVRFVRASPEPNVTDPAPQWNLGTMRGGAKCEFSLILRPINNEDIQNCTRISYEHGQCVTTRVAAAPPPGAIEPPVIDPGKKLPVEPPPGAKPKLSISAQGPAKQYKNRAARYFLSVTNTGDAPATNLLVTFTLAQKSQFVKASDNGEFLAGKVAWVLGTLKPGENRAVAVEVRSTAAGELCHKAAALADRGVSDQTEVCTTFEGFSALLLEMVDRDDPIEVGGQTSYPILIKNEGDAPLTNIRIRAIIPDGMILTRAKGPTDHRVGERLPRGQVLEFEPLAKLDGGEKQTYEVFVQSNRPGDLRFRVEVNADQLKAGPVIEEESTRVYEENGGPRKGPVIRDVGRKKN